MTEQTQALTTVINRDVVSRIAEYNSIAEIFSKSGLFTDVKSQGQAFVKIMAGAEIGLPPFTSMNAFHIIQGKVTMSANTIAARVKSSQRYDYRVAEKTAAKCSIEFYERGKLVFTETWTAERAQKAGTQNMNKYPEAMLFARAITSGARAVCPDIIGSFYAPEELGAIVNDEGVIEGESTPVQSQPEQKPAPEDDKLGRNGQDADLSKPADNSKIHIARERVKKHGAIVGGLMPSMDDATKTFVSQLLATARAALKDDSTSISDLHQIADKLKEFEPVVS